MEAETLAFSDSSRHRPHVMSNDGSIKRTLFDDETVTEVQRSDGHSNLDQSVHVRTSAFSFVSDVLITPESHSASSQPGFS